MRRWLIEDSGNAINIDLFAELIVCMKEDGTWTVRGQYLDNRSIEISKCKSEKDARKMIDYILNSKA